MSLAEEDNSSAGYLGDTICAMATSETGPPGAGRAERPLGEGWVYSVVANDPHGELVDRTGVGEGELAQIDELMAALAGLRAAEQELTRASLTYMQLNETDMKALHYLIVCEQQGVVATPSTIAAHLGISSASTTKLLDRLEKGGHVRRSRHPSDRRALAISIEAATRVAATRTVGTQHARRFHAARRLTSEQREIVIDFLDDMAREISIADVDWGDPGDA